MSEQSPINRLISDAQSFQTLLNDARAADPKFASALMGSVVSADKNTAGSLAIAAVTVISTHYGLGWTSETDMIVGAIVVIVCNFVLNKIQLLRYRKSLPGQPSVPVAVPAGPISPVSPQTQPTPPTNTSPNLVVPPT